MVTWFRGTRIRNERCQHISGHRVTQKTQSFIYLIKRLAEWIANQITEACGWEQLPRYLIRDRDGAYGEVFIRRIRSMGIRDQPTSPRSPWQNGYAERLIGSIRRECLDHVVVLGECHLRHLLISPWRRMRRSRAPSN